MTDGISLAEVKLISQDAAKQALKDHSESLPEKMTPICYQVAEKVAERTTHDMTALLNNVFGADVRNELHLRDLHKDLFYLRDQRINAEQRRAVARQEIIRGLLRCTGNAILAAVLALAMLFGFNINVPRGY